MHCDFKKQLPDTIQTAPWRRQMLLFIVGWGGLNIIALAISVIVRAVLAARYEDPLALAQALSHISYPASINILTYLLLLMVLLIMAMPSLRRFWREFIRPSVIFKGFGYGALILLSGIALNTLYLVFGIELADNANESSITAIMRSYPVLSVLAFVIAGPVCEELTYRYGLFGLLGRINKYLAYAVTFVFFGLIHFDFTTTNLANELLNLPFYVIAGLLFCYIYEREGLATATYAHVTNNLVSFVFSLIGTDVLMRIL